MEWIHTLKVEKSNRMKFTNLNVLVNLVQNESISDELKSRYFDRIGAIILEVKARKDSINL